MTSCQFGHDPDRHPDPLQAHSKRTNTSKLSASSPLTEKSQLGIDFQPSDLSVICGRGKSSYDHPGNYCLRVLASAFVVDYSKAGRKLKKSAIVANVVAVVRQEGGCFCRYENGTWFEVGDYFAREKVSGMFRDMLHTQYRSSTKAKTTRRRDQKAKHNQNETQTQYYGLQLVVGTRHSKNDGTERVGAMPSSYGYSGSSTDSLGFDHSQEVDFFDIDVF
jgi:hypothetical protein